MEFSKTISEQIVDFVLNLNYQNIPDQVIHHGKLLLSDTFGVAMACQELEHAKAVRKTVMEFRSEPQCSLWGTDQKAALADGVLYNACLIHGMDYDDTHVGAIIHPSAAVVSTAFAVGEYVNASGRQLLEAIVAGWEVIIRLGLAAKGRFHDVGYHGTGIAASFAAACVAAKLMGDSRETLVNALGICGSQSAAIQEFLNDGTWTKKIHPGWGAHSAIYALSLARNGYTGPKKVFEGRFGIWMTHCGGTDGLKEAFSDLGTVWRTSEITVKMYPVCHMTHSSIDCVTALMEQEGFAATDIDHMECRIAKRYYSIVCEPREAKIRPQTDYMMRFSLPFVTAVAAVKGRVSPSEIDLKYAGDEAVCALMDKTDCIADDSKDNPGHFPGYLKITLKDGRSFEKEQRFEMGTKENPLNLQAVNRKLRDNLEPFYPEQQIEDMAQCLENIDAWENVSGFLEILRHHDGAEPLDDIRQ